MGLPAYFGDTASMATLPVSWDPLSNPYAATREEIKIQTGRGVTFEYELFTRATPIYIFTMSASQLADFRAMYDAVIGSAFYFIPDIDLDGSPTTALHVRIKNPSFLPEPLGVFVENGAVEQYFRWILELEEEITASDIED